jgi:hypothetical protein
VYRLIKAGLEEHELYAFLRPRGAIADYQAVLFLLAVDTGTPLAAKDFFDRLEAGSGTQPVSVEWLVNEMKKNPEGQDDEWQRLRQWLTEQRDVLPRDADLSVLRTWSARVGRYSFEVRS